MSFNPKEVIELFSSNKFRLVALILILVSISLVAWIKVYYSIDDCKPLVEQNKVLIEQNSLLVDQNTQILKKNQYLLDSYLKIQDLLGSISTDTVFITRIEKDRRILFNRKSQSQIPDSPDSEVSYKIESPIEETPQIKVTSKIKTGNKEKVISEIQRIIEESNIK
jgi:hypothetical protein